MIAVIMAGGVGSRFWPRSRVKHPKQLLDIITDQSMLRVTYDRLTNITDTNKIFVVAGPALVAPIKHELPEMPAGNLIVEPSGKNTAPCIGLMAALLRADEQDDVMGVFPADHLITDEKIFAEDVRTGANFSGDHNALITFGIQPTKPATGYGYIEFDHRQSFFRNQIFKVASFTEKPNRTKAENMFASGDYLWNSGMFLWRISSILKAFQEHLPEMYSHLEKIAQAKGQKNFTDVLNENWEKISCESIDYGIMEQAGNVYVIRGRFEWNDVGSWDALYDISPKDEAGNFLDGNIKAINIKNCFFHSRDTRIAAVGVEDLIVIKSSDALLIVNRGDSESVKEVVNQLKADAEIEYL
ncbi:MAG: mannose-1-phosphate guanylyltransferase [Candidatus Marinimicrobia bacterium]|nr:mannose-1-phosphate guanylyltransferase [Candidatus Neomarinimicrobiota bacterium]